MTLSMPRNENFDDILGVEVFNLNQTLIAVFCLIGGCLMKTGTLSALAGMALACGCVKHVKSSVLQNTTEEHIPQLTLRGPFAELNSPENVANSQSDKDTWRDGAELTLENGNKLKVAIKIRGNNSLNECTFRKLSLKWDKTAANLNPLGALSNKLKIGTHCAKIDGPTKVLGNDLSPARENFLLKVFSLMSAQAIKSDVAKIRYIDSSTDREIGTYFALLREHEDEFASAHQMAAATTEEALDLNRYDSMELARQILFQSFAANTDWNIGGLGGESFGPRTVWNLSVYKSQDAAVALPRLTVVPTDLDVAGTVVKLGDTRLRGFIKAAGSIQKLSLSSSALFSLEMLFRNVASLPLTVLPRLLASFHEIRPGIESLMSSLDSEARVFFRNHMSDFYTGLSLFEKVATVKAGAAVKTVDGPVCTVRSNSLVLIESRQNGMARVSVPFVDDDGVPFCAEGFSPQSGLLISESEITTLNWDR
jgi:hypothetical protein